jgi:hypothetical protein
MKKVVLFFFLFFGFMSSGQTYTFTTYASYKMPKGISSYDTNYMYNINNDFYHITFIRGTYHFEAKLYDEKSKTIHIFDVKENEDKIVSEFEYKHSRKMNFDFSDCFFDYEETKYQDSLTKINLIFYRSKRKKKISYSRELVGEKSNYNHFLFFRKRHLHDYGYAKNLLFKDDIIVTNYGNDEFAITLNELKEINITITIDKIIFD